MIYDCLHRIPERLGRKIIRSITKFNKFSGYLENKKITGFVYNCSKYLKTYFENYCHFAMTTEAYSANK